MTTRPSRRKLKDHLAGWDAEQVARLLQRRPDLAGMLPPADRTELARRAQEFPSVSAAIDATTLPENRLLQVVVCCRPSVPEEELAAALPEGATLAQVEPVLSSLEEAALVWRHGGRVHCSGTLRQAMPTTLGPPLDQLINDQTVDYLKDAIRRLRAAAADGGFTGPLPPAATGPQGRPPRKAELIEELESLVSAPGLVAAVLSAGDDEVTELAQAMAGGRPTISVDYPLYHSPYRLPRRSGTDPAYWLYERALVLPPRSYSSASQPREVGVALRGGRPVADLALEAPALAVGLNDGAEVDRRAGAQAARALDRLADLLERSRAEPLKALKSGGLGVSALKKLAAGLEVEVEEATRLVELAYLAGLIDVTTHSHKAGRTYTYDSYIGPSAAAAPWAQRPVPRRWRQLARAWLRAERWPGVAGSKDAGGKPTPALGHHHAPTAPGQRRQVLDAVAALGPGQATTADAVAEFLYWHQPQAWLYARSEGPAAVIGSAYAEAELLGIVADGSLSSFGQALLDDDTDQAEKALDAALPEAVTTFTLQADLTATAVGALDRDVLVELRLLAEVESTGVATTFRFSDASLRRALDAGRDAEAILAFLEAHAAKGVPKPLAYLVGDVARRHGHLQVGAAGCVVTSDDPAVLADACSHRKTRKLDLRPVAPTVAVSPLPPAKVLDGLRDAGFLPTGDGDGADGAPGTVGIEAPDSGPARPGPKGELPERFVSRSGRRADPEPAVDPGQAAALAEAIVAGQPLPWVRGTGRPGGGSPPLPGRWDDGDDPSGSIDRLLEVAAAEARVVAVSLGDDDPGDPEEPVLLAVTRWQPGMVEGVDLADGATMTVPTDLIEAAVDIAPAAQLTNVAPLRRPGRRSGRSW